MELTAFHVTVDAHEVAVTYPDGGAPVVLGPGRHRRVRRQGYVSVGTAWRHLQLAPQEIPTADGAQVKVTAVARVRVTDPVLALGYEEAEQAVYLAIQLALRNEFAQVEVADAPAAPRKDPELAARILARAVEAGREVGYEVASVVVRDVMLPQDLRAASVELLTARTRGLAQLESARAETAALRTLANGAKILEDHPALAKLRMVQAIPMGSSLSLRVDDES